MGRLLVCRSGRHWMEGDNLRITVVKRKQPDGSILMVEKRRCRACDNERHRLGYNMIGRTHTTLMPQRTLLIRYARTKNGLQRVGWIQQRTSISINQWLYLLGLEEPQYQVPAQTVPWILVLTYSWIRVEEEEFDW